MAVDFCDYFWGEEHNGWNILYQNMKQGHNASKELAEFFKERWSIDEAYCKALLKLANKANVNSEKGTLAPLFTLLKSSSEKMSTIHLHMVNRVQDLVKDIVKYNEELHKKQKQVKDEESQTEDVMKNIQTTSGLALKAKEIYSQRCQDLEKAKRDGASPKDVEKAESKLRKAHDEYKSLVEKYNAIRDEFEKRMIQSCKRFQSVEEAHLSQILLFVQTYIYVLQTDQNAMGQILQELMNKYSEFTIDKLLDNFALSKLTGLEKPVTMVFEDTSSLGSAISGQQSPEPADQSKSSADDASSVGGGEKTSSGGVLTGGKVGVSEGSMSVLSGVAKLSSSRKMYKSVRSGRTSLFSLPKASCSKYTNHESNSNSSRSCSCDVIAGDLNHANTECTLSINASAKISRIVCESPCTTHPVNPVTYRRPELVKSGRRTTSLFNLFVASAHASENTGNVQERSAPPQLKFEENVSEGDRVIDENGCLSEDEPPKWSPITGGSLLTSTKMTSTPTSPTGATDESAISRSLFRSSKWFLRSRRDKKKR